MDEIIINKTIKRNILRYFILCWLLCLPGKIQASANKQDNPDTEVNNNDKKDKEMHKLVLQKEQRNSLLKLVLHEKRGLATNSAIFGAIGTFAGYTLWAFIVYGRHIMYGERESVWVNYGTKRVVDKEKSQLEKTIYYSHATGEVNGTIVGAAAGLGLGKLAGAAIGEIAAEGATVIATALGGPVGAGVCQAIKFGCILGGALIGKEAGHEISENNNPPKVSYISYDERLDKLGVDRSNKKYAKITYKPIYRYKYAPDRRKKKRLVAFNFSSLIPSSMRLAGQIGCSLFTVLFLAFYRWGNEYFFSKR